jgi:hypothetical protein
MELRKFIATTIREYLKEQNENVNYNKFPLNSLVIFARQFNNFKEFSNWYSIELNHGYYWHITDKQDFSVSSDVSPRDMSSMAGGETQNFGDLMITGDLEYWDEHYNTNQQTWKRDVKRNYVVLFNASELNPKVLRQVSRGFGNEIYLNKTDARKLKIVGVYDLKYAKQLNRKFQNIIPQSENSLLELWKFANSK